VKDTRYYCVHIIECINRVMAFTEDGEAAFLESELIQSAVTRQLQIMIQSTFKLPEELKAQHPEIEWQKLKNFRNRLVHDYDGVELSIIWRVVENNLIPLRDTVQQILDSLP